MKNFTQKLFLTVFMALALPVAFYAQTIFSNEITGTNPNTDNPYTSGQVVAANATATGIGRGTGINGNNANNRYNARDWSLTALDANDYFTFTITPATGYALNFTGAQFTAQKSNTGPVSFAVRSSLDNYVASVYTFSPEGNNFDLEVDLSGAAFQGVTSAITFRIYGWGGSGDAGTFSINDFVFNGTVSVPCAPVALPTAAAQAFCGNATVSQLTVTTGTAVQWYAAETGGTALAGTTALSTGTYYVSQTVNGCESARTAVAVTVNTIPAAPTAVSQSFCGSGTVANLVVTTGTGIQWYANETGGTALAGTTALTTGSYFASQTVNGCESTRIAVAVTIDDLPATPTAIAQTFCGSGTVADLTVTTGTTIQWYAAETGGTALAGTIALATGTYYASQTVTGCESARIAVAVTVNTIPAAPTAAAQSFCGSGTVANLVVTTGTGVFWYANETGGTALDATEALATGTYYASQTVNGCESTRTAVAVTVNAIPAAPMAAAQAFCESGTVSNLVVTTGTSVQWYAAQTGGTALAGTAALATGTYYASQTVNGCESTRTAVAVTVNAIPAAPTAAAQAFCGSGTISNLVVTTGTAVQWYATQTGGTALAGTAALTSGTYYASQTVNGCESARTAVAVTVNTLPAAPAAAAQSFCGSGTVANLVVTTGTSVQWYAAQTGGTALAGTAALTSGTYYASQTVNGCESARTAVAVTVNTLPAAPTAANLSFCGSATVADLTVTTGTALQWYVAQTGGTALAADAAVSTGVYFVSQTVNGCESARAEVNVTVTNTPTAPVGNATQDFEEGDTLADLDVTGTGLVWYADEDLTDELPADTELEDETTYYVVAVNGDCNSEVLAITVNEVLSAGVAVKNNIVVYPNPLKDVLYFKGTADITSVEVYNLLGQAVISQLPNATEFSIDMSQLAAGNYIVKAFTQNGMQTLKVVKE
ncbi:Ig-like domain-containing protein [Flavobacterium akiainvivens]|uniref:Ig-like domain-containing protein n=1 Tax=Flavobacterium akiainvivens TaxID=1202724 RepID=UPI0006C89513|nr:T9SS type A sorting domain-containing protein [Flavobacterium akiainvivens]SFQ65507.1 Por secretion system C-terminal sorting domain-containing protein [Flavobacterium akiainvivens]